MGALHGGEGSGRGRGCQARGHRTVKGVGVGKGVQDT